MLASGLLLLRQLKYAWTYSFSLILNRLVLGENSRTFQERRFVAAKTLSGTGALKIAAEFLAKKLFLDTFYVSTPTWENHHRIFISGGFKTKNEYRYWDKDTKGIDFQGLIQDLKSAPRKSAIIFQVIAQNPTGVDLSQSQWLEVGKLCQERDLFPVFDCVRVGFVSDLFSDSFVLRLFADELEMEFVVCQSFAKNFALYNERIGNVFFILKDPSKVENVKSQLTLLIRGTYSNPPCHGSAIVSRILNSGENRKELDKDLSTVRKRVTEMRQRFYNKLVEYKVPGNWDHVKSQKGIFVYSGITESQVDLLRDKYSIYLLRCCHINVTCLNEKNIDYVVSAIFDVLKKK